MLACTSKALRVRNISLNTWTFNFLSYCYLLINLIYLILSEVKQLTKVHSVLHSFKFFKRWIKFPLCFKLSLNLGSCFVPRMTFDSSIYSLTYESLCSSKKSLCSSSLRVFYFHPDGRESSSFNKSLKFPLYLQESTLFTVINLFLP